MRLSDIQSSFLAADRELSAHVAASDRICARGIRLIAQGERAANVSFITDGVVKISFIEQQGRERICNLRAAGSVIGVDAALLNVPSLLTVTTVTECRTRRFPSERVREAVRIDGAVAFHMSRLLAQESLDQTASMVDAASGTARDRLIHFLRQIEADLHAGGLVTPGNNALLKRNEIAKLLGITPEHLSRLVKALQHEGVVQPDKRQVVLRGHNRSAAASR